MNTKTKSTAQALHTTALIGFFFAVVSVPVVAAAFSGNLKEVTITDAQATNKPPVAEFSYTVNGNAVTFDASGSSDSDGSISTYKWDFGDGTTGEGATAAHQFSATSAPVTLTVIDDKGGVAIAQSSIKLYTEVFEIIVDDADTANFSTVGSWSDSKSTKGYYNKGYKTAPSGNGSSMATWTINIPTNGNYEIFCYYTASGNRASNAPFSVTNNGKVIANKAVNQQINGSIFISLGKYALNQGKLQVTLSDAGNGYLIADAVKVTSTP
ncbi:PKD domain-containing protein [Desulfobulbus elongatus]|uniref:golvesin C-terminal-like domain-containing protein n=1 Tax=Desulfobulbus elongatus TaxID=53332 RepID=UPI00047FA326|nr:PKD domain-containing protein [Desulfobulbus elongatus]